MNFDIANGLFELGGGLMAFINCRRLWRDRTVSGVYWPTTAFFSCWGWWNLLYYPSLGQWWSAAGGVTIASCNTAWVIMALIWRRSAP